MNTFQDKENRCALQFLELGQCYHLWTPENFQIIFTDKEEHNIGMNMLAIAAKAFPQVKILTFELMSNHLHITAAGPLDQLLGLFNLFKKMLRKHKEAKGLILDWRCFVPKTREITTVEDLRTVIVYNNRNGALISPDYTALSYPWGANRYYFNEDAKELEKIKAAKVTVRELRQASHSKEADKIEGLWTYGGHISPLSFCDIHAGESTFRDAPHYLMKLTRNIEANKKIAAEIGESIYYTDDELYSVIVRLGKERYSCTTLGTLPPEAKLDLAKTMRYTYNASTKQIKRFLKLTDATIQAAGL